jgi:hypothetical protein
MEYPSFITLNRVIKERSQKKFACFECHECPSQTFNKNTPHRRRWFGTYYLPEDKKEPVSVGLANDDMTNRFWSQMIYPFIKLTRMKAR